MFALIMSLERASELFYQMFKIKASKKWIITYPVAAWNHLFTSDRYSDIRFPWVIMSCMALRMTRLNFFFFFFFFFFLLQEKIEGDRIGDSYKYPQHMFYGEIRGIISLIH